MHANRTALQRSKSTLVLKEFSRFIKNQTAFGQRFDIVWVIYIENSLKLSARTKKEVSSELKPLIVQRFAIMLYDRTSIDTEINLLRKHLFPAKGHSLESISTTMPYFHILSILFIMAVFVRVKHF